MVTPIALIPVNGKIYTIGGTNNWGAIPLVIMEEYDPVTDTWVKKTDMPTARCLLTTSAVNGRIYAIGGGFGPGQGFSTVEEYDTGFRDSLAIINTEDKLTTTWGEIMRTK